MLRLPQTQLQGKSVMAKGKQNLRLATVRSHDNVEATFLLNRYGDLQLQKGDTIIFDVDILLSKEEWALYQSINELQVRADGAPADHFASILAKVFDAGRSVQST